MRQISKLAMAMALGLGLYACGGNNGNNNNNNNNNSNNRPPAAFVQDNVQKPVENSTYQIGDLVPVQFTVPTDPDGDTLTAEATLGVDENGNGTIDAGEATKTEDLGSVVGGDTVNDGIDTTGLPAGNAYVTVKVNDGKGGESSLERKVTLEEAQAFDFGCEVISAAVGAGFMMDCTSETQGVDYELLSTTLNGATMGYGTIGTSILSDSDIEVHTFEIKATQPTLGELTKTYIVSVDKHLTQIRGCDGSNYLVPEVTADRVASACIPGYNESLKPTSSGSDYVLDLTDLTCAKTQLANAPAQEKKSWESYRKNPETMFDGCDTTQITYSSVE